MLSEIALKQKQTSRIKEEICIHQSYLFFC